MLKLPPKTVVIFGANASGKTEIALKLAKILRSEIISADSRQIYKHLFAGTSKPSGRWEKDKKYTKYIVDGIPYHIVDIVDPLENYNVSRYLYDFKEALNKTENDTVIIAGGTGLYIHSIFSPIDPLPEANQKIREELTMFAQKYGREKLYNKLLEIDPVSAKKIHKNNIHRIIRALEVSILTNRPYSSLISNKFMKDITFSNALFIYIKWKKELLYERIKQRTKKVFDDWVKETQNLLSMGYPVDCPGLKSLGYPVIIDYINGKISKEQSVEIITKQSIAYAKRQNTWFKRYLNSIKIEINDIKDFDTDKIVEFILDKYESSFNIH